MQCALHAGVGTLCAVRDAAPARSQHEAHTDFTTPPHQHLHGRTRRCTVGAGFGRSQLPSEGVHRYHLGCCTGGPQAGEVCRERDVPRSRSGNDDGTGWPARSTRIARPPRTTGTTGRNRRAGDDGSDRFARCDGCNRTCRTARRRRTYRTARCRGTYRTARCRGTYRTARCHRRAGREG